MSQQNHQYILAIDQGTTSCRAIIFNETGVPVATAQQEFTQFLPQAGHVEHDAAEIWRVQLDMCHAAIKKAGISATQLSAIGITNQRETVVLWDRATGEPVAPALVWQDVRTATACDTLRDSGHAEMIAAKTGLVLNPYFSASKLAWLLHDSPNAADLYRRAQRGELCFGTIDSWLIFKLSGLHVTDVSNASRTLLFNINTMAWDDDLLALFDIPRAILPSVVPSSGICGHTTASVLGAAVPIAGIAGDQQAATFGQACFALGMAKNTYGTGCFMLMNTGSQPVPSKHQLLATVGWSGLANQSETQYMLEGSVFMGGATVQWLRDGLGIIKNAAEVEALASSVLHSDGVVMVPAFVGLGAPYWDAHARGTLLGMTRGTGRGHIAYAALQAITLQVADVFAAMQADAKIALAELRVDGGASNNNLLMQMQADILGVPVVRPKVTETTALGAAYLAGLAVGVWQCQAEIAALWQIDRRFEPKMSASQRTETMARWHRAVAAVRSF